MCQCQLYTRCASKIVRTIETTGGQKAAVEHGEFDGIWNGREGVSGTGVSFLPRFVHIVGSRR